MTHPTSTLPPWLHKPLYSCGDGTKRAISTCGVCTVCEEALCPNMSECYRERRATFLLLGPACTRACGFCHVRHNDRPAPPDPKEPETIAECCVQLGLRHAVLTMVTRDDLDDGGAEHVAATVRAIRARLPDATVEVLTSDFAGHFPSAAILLAEHPEIFAHNIETVRSLSSVIRSQATYEGSLTLLKKLKEANPSQVTKSSLMVGLGETYEEVKEALQDLCNVGVSMVTIGQYLQPTGKQVRVKEWIHPDVFAKYEEAARLLGITDVVAGPFVRSSYRSHPLQRGTP